MFVVALGIFLTVYSSAHEFTHTFCLRRPQDADP